MLAVPVLVLIAAAGVTCYQADERASTFCWSARSAIALAIYIRGLTEQNKGQLI